MCVEGEHMAGMVQGVGGFFNIGREWRFKEKYCDEFAISGGQLEDHASLKLKMCRENKSLQRVIA